MYRGSGLGALSRASRAQHRPALLRKSVSGAILTPKWVQNGLQNLSKMVRETASEFDIVFILFFKGFSKKMCMNLKMQRYAKNPRTVQVSLKYAMISKIAIYNLEDATT